MHDHRGVTSFLRMLAVALPVNLLVASLMFNNQTATLVFGSIAATAGSLLVIALEPSRLTNPAETPSPKLWRASLPSRARQRLAGH